MKITLTNINAITSYKNSVALDVSNKTSEKYHYYINKRCYTALLDKNDNIIMKRNYEKNISCVVRFFKATYDFFARAFTEGESAFKTRANQMSEALNKDKAPSFDKARNSFEKPPLEKADKTRNSFDIPPLYKARNSFDEGEEIIQLKLGGDEPENLIDVLERLQRRGTIHFDANNLYFRSN